VNKYPQSDFTSPSAESGSWN